MKKKYKFLLVFYDFEKLTSYILSMNLNFLLFAGKCRVDRYQSNFFLVTPMGSTLHQMIPPPNPLKHFFQNLHVGFDQICVKWLFLAHIFLIRQFYCSKHVFEKRLKRQFPHTVRSLALRICFFTALLCSYFPTNNFEVLRS